MFRRDPEVRRMRKKRNFVILILVAVAVGLMSIRLLFTLFPQKEAKADTSEGVSYLAAHESSTVSRTSSSKQEASGAAQEKAGGAAEKSGAADTTEQRTQPPKIKNGNFRAAYKDFLLSGDSLVKAICEYGILDDNQVIAKIGVGTSYLTETTDRIVAKKPKYLVLHYGENELDEKENAKYFIKRYKKCILRLKDRLPDTEIYVDSIFPVLEKAYQDEPYTVNIAYYNELLKTMAEEAGVHYLDFTPLWESAEKNYYDADGIHPLRTFYTEQYLPFVYKEVLRNH